MTAASNNLLNDPSISVCSPGGLGSASLPDVLEQLGSDIEIEFPALRPYQSHPWHAFLVQLGALVAARTGDPTLERSADAWRAGLLDLAGDAGEDAWCLLVEDPARPAFMQVAVPEGEWGSYKPAAKTPDDLDMLVTAKNHDVKRGLMAEARTEHWVYALVTLQTFQGFSGRGNYGIGRMNSGFGSRPGFAAAPSLSWGERFQRDVRVWLEQREQLLDSYRYDDQGQTLLWCLDWDGEAPRLPLEACDPFFIEVCRRVRLRPEGEAIVAYGAPSKSAFLPAKERFGDTGDIWTPVRVDDNGVASALTTSPSGLSYRKLQEVIFGNEWQQQPAMRIRTEDGDQPVLVAQVMARGQGKTEGYHERRIPLKGEARGWLMQPKTRALLGQLAKLRVERVGDVQRRILKPALCVLLQGAPDHLDLRDDRTQRWLGRLDQQIDQIFFEDLWADFGLSHEVSAEPNEKWEQRLFDLARAQLEDAIREAAVPEARSYKAVAKAEGTFRRAARNQLRNLFPPKFDDEGGSP
ncbi:MAG: type I-E CRISPR-associated protein Cse1/CasA [Acidobacteriota bacterium]